MWLNGELGPEQVALPESQFSLVADVHSQIIPHKFASLSGYSPHVNDVIGPHSVLSGFGEPSGGTPASQRSPTTISMPVGHAQPGP